MEPSGTSLPSDAPKRKKNRAYPFIIGTIACVGLLLIMFSGVSAGRYSSTITEITAHPDKYVGRQIRVVGKIKPGWTEKRVGTRIETHFTVHDEKGNEILVYYPHNRPDPFKEGRQCIVEGTLEKGPILKGTKLTVKCPSKYQSEDGAAPVGESLDDMRKRYQKDL